MTQRLFFIVVAGLEMSSCNSREKNSAKADEIVGAYAREYSFKVVNTENGKEIGMSIIRDTIFVRPKSDGYEVSNDRWRLNQYDNEGWKNMEHSEDRPMVTHAVTFDPVDNSLNSQLFVPLYLSLKEGKLRKGKGEHLYLKCKN